MRLQMFKGFVPDIDWEHPIIVISLILLAMFGLMSIWPDFFTNFLNQGWVNE